MKKIKVYNLKKKVEEDYEGITTYHYDDEVAIVQNEKNDRALMFISEGVGECYNINEKYKISVDRIHENKNSVSIMPIGTIDIEIENIINTCEYRETYIRDFIRKFGSRLQNNFNEILQSIDEIGLNSKDYYYKKAKK